jgi:signal peptide peptidase SppA
VANTLAASAAYWLASAASELVVTPSGEVGSIGVFAIHEDYSAALDRVGVKVSLISAGKYKTEGNPFEPLGEEAQAAVQGTVNDYYDMFIRAVARGRGVSQADVIAGFGEGRVVMAEQAVRLGMADRVATIDEVIGGLQAGSSKGKQVRADDGEDRLRRLRAYSR